MSIVICYHYPCLDGAFSLLSAFLGVQSYLAKHDYDSLFNQIYQVDQVQFKTPLSSPSLSTSSSSLNEEQKFQFIPQAPPPPNLIFKQKITISVEKKSALTSSSSETLLQPQTNLIQNNDNNISFKSINQTQAPQQIGLSHVPSPLIIEEEKTSTNNQTSNTSSMTHNENIIKTQTNIIDQISNNSSGYNSIVSSTSSSNSTSPQSKFRKQSLCNINSPPFDISSCCSFLMEDSNLNDPSYFNPQVHPNIQYVGLTPSSVPEKIIETIYSNMGTGNKKNEAANSIIILMDFYGGSKENVLTLAREFKKVIILDHHISFIKLVEAHEFASIKNLYYRYDINKSGATLSYDFFKERLELDRLCSFGVLQRLKEFLPCIEDDDIKAEKISYSRDVTSAMYNKFKEFNPQIDGQIFYKLLSSKLDELKQLGKQINGDIVSKVELEIRNRRRIYIGGKKDCICIGYGLTPKENYLTGDIAVRLAEISIQEHLDNIGIAFIQININGQEHYKISLRSSKLSEGICDIVAEQFGGGGHKCASGFTISRHTFHKWIE